MFTHMFDTKKVIDNEKNSRYLQKKNVIKFTLAVVVSDNANIKTYVFSALSPNKKKAINK